MSEKRCTLKGVTLKQVLGEGTKAQVNIPGVGLKTIHQSGVHDDSAVWWEVVAVGKDRRTKGEFGPDKLILHGWYAEKLGLELD